MATVTVQDAREADPVHGPYCTTVMKVFFKRHNLDFRDFVRNGIPEEKLLATGDDSVLLIIEAARRREKLTRG